MKKSLKTVQIFSIFAILVATVFVGYKAMESNYYLPSNKAYSASQEGKTYNTSSILPLTQYAYTNYVSANDRLVQTYGADVVYSDRVAPSMRYQGHLTLFVGQTYDPLAYVTATHYKFGDVSDMIEVTYNNVDTSVEGDYKTTYRVCNYYGSSYCQTVTIDVIVRYQKSKVYEGAAVVENYPDRPSWSNYDILTCGYGDTSCSTYNIAFPVARDPYNSQLLKVSLTSGEVDVYQPGTYYLTYQATTLHGISGTVTRAIVINGSSNTTSINTNISTNTSVINDTIGTIYTYPDKKYITGYNKSYYNDGIYSGYLTLDASSNYSKYISNYEWANTVTYMYQCTRPGSYGTDGWKYIQTMSSDNHSTFVYNQDGYTGTLSKVSYYCKDGCDDKLVSKLGLCTYAEQGQYKYITRTWVGVYSGTVTYNGNISYTYSGYVYRN